MYPQNRVVLYLFSLLRCLLTSKWDKNYASRYLYNVTIIVLSFCRQLIKTHLTSSFGGLQIYLISIHTHRLITVDWSDTIFIYKLLNCINKLNLVVFRENPKRAERRSMNESCLPVFKYFKPQRKSKLLVHGFGDNAADSLMFPILRDGEL